MNSRIDISVCLTTYKRPQMLEQAIKSFESQQIKNAELVIVDDGNDILTKRICLKFATRNKSIRFIQNKKNIGFSKNLLKSFSLARGKYIYVLGDDDLIIGTNTLKKYIEAFNNNNDIGVIFGNILQFNNQFQVDNVYRQFVNNVTFKKGDMAFSSLWLKSTYIGGVGIRNTSQILELYPKDDILFPMVEFIGKILTKYNGYGLSSYTIGMRVHNDQLGFHVMKKKRITGQEKHGYIELYEIADRLNKFVEESKTKTSPGILYRTVKQFLQEADRSILLAESSHLPKSYIIKNILNIRESEKRVKHTVFFWLQLILFTFTPNFLISLLKISYRNIMRQTRWRRDIEFWKLQIQSINIHR